MSMSSGWKKVIAILVGLWVLSVIGQFTFEYSGHRDGIFSHPIFPRGAILNRDKESESDKATAAATGSRSPKDVSSRAIGQGKEPSIATEQTVHWRMLIGALTFPFGVLITVTLLSAILNRVGKKMGKPPG